MNKPQYTSDGRIVRLRDRVNFAQQREYAAYPDLLNLQIESYKDFLQEDLHPFMRKAKGLQQAFLLNFPIEDSSEIFQLEFMEYFVEKPKYSEEECRERELTYAKALKARMRLSSKADPSSEDFIDPIEQEVYLGNIPAMTPRGTFIINGAERVIVAQLHRSPGVFFDAALHPNGTRIYTARVIPFKGSWIEFTTDIHDVMYAYIDRKKKFPVTTLLRALGYSSDEQILGLFELAMDVPADQLDESYIGRRIGGDVIDISTGEILAHRDMVIDEALMELFKQSEIEAVRVFRFENVNDEPVIAKTLAKDTTRTREEALEVIYRQMRSSDPPDMETALALLEKLFFNDKRYDLGIVGRFRLNDKLKLNAPLDCTVLRLEDIVTIIKYLIDLHDQKQTVDDIDHLGNRRVRTVGEQLSTQFNLGLTRMSRTIKERLSMYDGESMTPSELVNARTITSVVNQFFGTNQLSQFMDQTNPLSELTHKRRTSALGPGGLTRERAGFEVRDVHYTHYGRLCPIETPEGPNIGLISSLAIHARVNEFGFIETPYRKVVKGKVTDEIEFLSAEKEEGLIITPASTEVDKSGKITGDRVKARQSGDFVVVSPGDIQYMDVSTDQITSPAASLIPFLEHDDANRALMGSNMQRQSVPLIRAEAPLVGTGMEYRAAVDAGDVVVSEKAGVVSEISADTIDVANEDGSSTTYKVQKFRRSNQGTSYNQKPIVKEGEKIKANQVLADGPCTDGGEMALGRNLLVAYMPWEGHNYEDAIILNQRLVQDDILTSIHIEEHEIDARDTKLGAEEITRDLPNVSEEVLADLDDRGIIRIGAEVVPGDILVGKVTPKGETELTPEERLLRAIFGEKAREVRDTSLKVPHGESGTVIDIKVFEREHDDEMGPGVNQIVRVYIAQKRKITEGDKLAGRHGNKGVIAKILPAEDMPFLEDGTPVDIVLNPLGVPGRMNLGQVLEFHLGWLAKSGWDIEGSPKWAENIPDNMRKVPPNTKLATPVFDGARESEITGLMTASLPSSNGDRLIGSNGKARLFDGRSGEPFPMPIAVGYKYILKLLHLVDDKIHARSTGPYSMITQQPLGGKAQFGGQRFGEMEVWALEAYGAAYALQELLTIKSDDVLGRVKVYEAIVKGENIPEPGIPESFKVLVKEMQSLGLNVEVLSDDGQAIEMRDTDEDVFRTAEELGIDLSRREPSSVEEV